MYKIIHIIALTCMLSCGSAVSNNAEHLTLKTYAVEDTIILRFKITDMLPMGWGTVYKIKLIEQVYGEIPMDADSLRMTVSVGTELKTPLNPHFLKLNQFYMAQFVNTQKKSETSYAPAGTTGFIAANGYIWEMISINTANMDTQVNITGKAYNAKSGAIIITDQGQTYYLEGMDYWPDDVHEKTVKVSGYIKQEFFNEKDLKNKKGEYTQGMIGEKLSIRNAKWELSNQ